MRRVYSSAIGKPAGRLDSQSIVGSEPEILLPGQLASRRAPTPEEMLLLAVLEQALRDLDCAEKGFKPWGLNRNARAFQNEVIGWFRSNRTKYVTDFCSICDVFGLDPSAVRRTLRMHSWHPAEVPTHGIRLVCPGRPRRLSP